MSPSDDKGTAPEVEVESLGLTLGNLTDDLRAQFGIADDVTGVVITAVADAGPAFGKGIKAGDVIVEVGQEPVATPEDVEVRVKAAADAGRGSVLLLVQSGGDLRFVPLSIGG